MVKSLNRRGIEFKILDSGYLKGHLEGVIKEVVFPTRLFFKKSSLYHSTHPLGAKWAILLNKKPLVTTIHDLIPLEHKGRYSDWGFKYRVKGWSIIFSARHSDHVIVPFQSTKNFLVENCQVPEEKITIINYGVNHQKYYPLSNKKNRKQKVIFFVGELAQAKGVDTLIKATQVLIRKNRKVILMLGSNGKDKRLLIDLACRLEIVDRVRFVGRIPEEELPTYYRRADISVFPSRYGFGLATLEAMACGTPVIAGKALDAPDFIDDERMLTDPDDYQELAIKMDRILYNESLREELSQYGIQKARQYSWERMTAETLMVYQKLVG